VEYNYGSVAKGSNVDTWSTGKRSRDVTEGAQSSTKGHNSVCASSLVHYWLLKKSELGSRFQGVTTRSRHLTYVRRYIFIKCRCVWSFKTMKKKKSIDCINCHVKVAPRTQEWRKKHQCGTPGKGLGTLIPAFTIQQTSDWSAVNGKCKSRQILGSLCNKHSFIIIQTFFVLLLFLSFGGNFIWMIRQNMSNINRKSLSLHISYALPLLGFLELYQGTVTTSVFTWEWLQHINDYNDSKCKTYALFLDFHGFAGKQTLTYSVSNLSNPKSHVYY